MNQVNGAASDTDPTSFGDDFLNGGRFKCRVFPNGGPCTNMESFSSSASGNWVNTTEEPRTMPDTAYAYVELTYDQEKRVTSLTGRLQFNVTGRTVKPITSSTTAESYGAASLLEITSNNPAEVMVDYLTNTQYGAGVPLSAIDFASFNSHKEFCDQTVLSSPIH